MSNEQKDDTRVNALLQALQQQRDEALNKIVYMSAEIVQLKERLAEFQKVEEDEK